MRQDEMKSLKKRVLITIDEGFFIKSRMGVFYEEGGKRFYMEMKHPEKSSKTKAQKIYFK